MAEIVQDEVSISIKTSADEASSSIKNLSGNIKGLNVAMGALKIGVFVKGLKDIGTTIGKFVTQTSDYISTFNNFNNIMGDSTNKATEFIEKAERIFGLDPSKLMSSMSTFQRLGEGFGLASDEAYKMSLNLTQLASDMTTTGLSFDNAMQKLKSGISGELEPMRAFGVALDKATLQQTAYKLGIDRRIDTMTRAQKTELAYYQIMTQTTNIQGQLARTMVSPTIAINQMKNGFSQLGRAIGSMFIPLVMQVIPYVRILTQLATKAAQALAALFGFKLTDYTASSGGLADISEGIEDIGNSASGTAKKLQKMLMPFDELNNVNFETGKGSGGSGGIGAGGSLGIDLPEYDMFAGATDKLSEKIERLKNKISELFSTQNEAIGNIKNSLIEIWTDPEALKSAQRWSATLYNSFFTVSNSIIRIGMNTIEYYIGGIEKYLSQNSNRIKRYITNMLDISSENINLTTTFIQAIAQISDIFKSDTAKQIQADIIAMFANPIMSLLEVGNKFIRDMKKIFFQPIIDNTDKIKTALDNTLRPFEKVIKVFTDMFTFLGDKINEVYDKYLQPFFNDIGSGLSDTVSKFLEVYNEYIAPFIDKTADKFSGLWENHLKPLFNELGELFGSVISLIQVLWNNELKPFIDWFIANVLPQLMPVFESLYNTLADVFGKIFDILGGVIKVFKGVIDFLVGVFTGDWDKAWQGIETIFSGIWNIIWGVISGVWTLITGYIDAQLKNIKAAIETIFSGIANTVSNVWNSIKNGIIDKVTQIKNNITEKFTQIKDGMVDKFTNARNTVLNIFDNIRNGITERIENAKNRVQEAINRIKSFFNFSWSLPKLKIPHLSWTSQQASGWIASTLQALNLPTSLPKLKIDWYADGGFPEKGQLFFANEAGAELVGNIGNKTAVANQDQITEGIASATYNAFSKALSENKSNGENTPYILVQLGNDTLYNGYGKYKNQQSNMYGVTI